MGAPKKSSGGTAKVRRLRGGFLAKGKRFAIVVSRFNEFITSRLLEGALETLVDHGVDPRHILVAHVPGALELELAARRIIEKKKPHAVIALAVIIRGQTKHFDQVSAESARGLADLARASRVPVILGVIPAENAAQAIERAGVKQMNKGREWALAAIETANLLGRIQ